jgi:hypothetical protein
MTAKQPTRWYRRSETKPLDALHQPLLARTNIPNCVANGHSVPSRIQIPTVDLILRGSVTSAVEKPGSRDLCGDFRRLGPEVDVCMLAVDTEKSVQATD